MAIFTLAGAAIAGAIGLGATAASLISAGLALAANFAVSYFTRQKQKAGQAREKRVAISGSIQFGADVPAWTVYGTTALVGHRVFYGYWGTGDEYNAEVFVLANGRCEGLANKVFFYGQEHTLVSATTIGDEDEHWKVSGFGDLISIRFYAGRPDQLADGKLVSDTAGLDNNWKSTSTLTGLSYVVVERKFDVDKFSDGRPEFKWVLNGLRCYDWRKDTTVSGGSGTHRADDPSTWEHTSNPAICRANFELGLKGLESDRAIIGMGKAFGELHLASYTAAANACDVDRTKNSRTFKTYQIGMIVDSEEDFTEVLRDFDDAMAGYAFNASGLSGVIAGYAQTSAFTITADDIRMDAPKTRRNRRPTTELYNHLTGSFTAPSSLYNPEPLTPVTVNADVTADKRRRSLAYDFTQVNDPDIAQYLLNIRYRQMRLGGFTTLPVSKRLAFQVEGGDWATYDSKTWVVMGRRPDAGGYVLELAETASSVYSETGIAVGPVVTTPSAPVFFEQTTVSGFGISAFIEQDPEAGGGIPVIELEWTAPGNVRIDWLTVQYRKVGTTVAEERQFTNVEVGFAYLRGLAGSTEYEARAAYVYDGFKQTAWTHADGVAWARVTTDVPVGAPPPDFSVSLAKFGLDVVGIQAAVERSLDQAERILEAAITSDTLHQLETYIQDGVLKALIAASEGRSKALVVEESIARTSAVEALAAQSLLVQAEFDGSTATGLAVLEAVANESTATTTFGWLLRAEAGDDFEEAGLSFEVTPTGSRVAVKADQFVLDNGHQLFAVTEDGTFLKDVYFERLRSSPSITAYSIDINALNGSISLTVPPS
jgi:hypothetical protein